jgi:hypothetical protein
MDDLRRRFATLDAVPTPLDWTEVERRATAVASAAATPSSVGPTSVRRASGPLVRPNTSRPRHLALLVAVALVAALVAGVVGFGGLLNRQNAVLDASPSPTATPTSNPTPTSSIAPSPSVEPTPSAAAVSCPGVEAPKEVRITEVLLPGKKTSPLGRPVVAGCAVWITSGQNGGGIHRIDLATGKVTNSNPAEVVLDLDAVGDELWAIGQPKPADAAGHEVLYRLDPATGATIRELHPLTFSHSLRIVDGRAWIGSYRRPIEVIDLASGEHVASVDVASVDVAARGLQVGAGAVWDGLSRIDPVTFEVTELQTTFPANQVVIAADRLYGIDQVRGEIARIDPVTGTVLTSIHVENWTGGAAAAERGSIWVLRTREPAPGAALKAERTEILRVDAATGQIAERIPYDVIQPAINFFASEGNLWLMDQGDSYLRHMFIRFELPASR